MKMLLTFEYENSFYAYNLKSSTATIYELINYQ